MENDVWWMKVMWWGDLCCDNQIDQKWLKWMNWWVVWNGIVKHFDKVIWNNIIMSFEKQNSLFLCLREFTHFPFYSTSHSVLLWRSRWKSTLGFEMKNTKNNPKKTFPENVFVDFHFIFPQCWTHPTQQMRIQTIYTFSKTRTMFSSVLTHTQDGKVHVWWSEMPNTKTCIVNKKHNIFKHNLVMFECVEDCGEVCYPRDIFPFSPLILLSKLCFLNGVVVVIFITHKDNSNCFYLWRVCSNTSNSLRNEIHPHHSWC